MFREPRETRYTRIACVLGTDPDAIPWALENISRWRAHGRLNPDPLDDWQRLLEAAASTPEGLEKLISIFTSAKVTVKEDQLRSCSPFVGGPFAPAMK